MIIDTKQQINYTCMFNIFTYIRDITQPILWHVLFVPCQCSVVLGSSRSEKLVLQLPGGLVFEEDNECFWRCRCCCQMLLGIHSSCAGVLFSSLDVRCHFRHVVNMSEVVEVSAVIFGAGVTWHL